MNRVVLIAAGVVVALVGVFAVSIAPDRMNLPLLVAEGGANEIVVPFGYWIGVGLWAWLATRLLAATSRRVVPRVIAVAITVHLMVLLAASMPRLTDPLAFSAPFYHLYARLFYGTALACAVAWSTKVVQRLRLATMTDDLLDVPALAGTVVLSAAVVQSDGWVALGASAIGLVPGLGWTLAWIQTGRLAQAGRIATRLVKDERVYLVVMFFLALGLRLLYLRRVMTDPGYVATGGDGPIYDALAWSVATGDGIPESFRNGYPLLLLGYVWFAGAVYGAVGHSYFILCAVQSVLGAVTCVLLYVVAKELFGEPVARVAAAFTAISFPLLFAAASIGHQAVDGFLTLLAVYLLTRAAAGRRTAWYWLGVGAILGCAIAVRETNLFVLLLLVLWIPYLFHRRQWPGGPRAVMAVTIGAAVVIAPLLLPTVSSSDGRLRLRQHFDRLYTGQGDPVRTRKDLVGPLANPGAAVVQLREQPAVVVATIGRAVVHNFAVQFFTQPYGGFDLVFLLKGSAYYYGLWFYAYVLAGAGCVGAMRRGRAPGGPELGVTLVLGVIVFRSLPHLILESHYRHRVPIEPLLIMLAAVGVVSLIELSRRRYSRPLVP